MRYRDHDIALIIPCYNEGITIYDVVIDFKQTMPELAIYVFDNNSTDNSIQQAEKAGAEIIRVKRQGKGNVVRQMFADVDADVYVMVDGDNTYQASAIHRLVDKLIDEKLDMVVGCREVAPEIAELAYRSGHQWGNRVLTNSVRMIFGGEFTDMLSGYRAFSRRFVKSYPPLSQGFETETELTVHVLALDLPYGEVNTTYLARPAGSESKLSTYKDGARIMLTILKLFMHEKPMLFFGIISALFAFVSIFISIPIFSEYLASGLVPRFPTAFLSASLMIISILALFSGLILYNIRIARYETKHLIYLNVKNE